MILGLFCVFLISPTQRQQERQTKRKKDRQMLLQILRESIFQDKLLLQDDDREALVTFKLPGLMDDDGQLLLFALYPPKWLFWKQLTVVSTACDAMMMLMLMSMRISL